MDDYELEKYCDAHPYCDCNCMKCPGFAASIPELQNDNDDDEHDHHHQEAHGQAAELQLRDLDEFPGKSADGAAANLYPVGSIGALRIYPTAVGNMLGNVRFLAAFTFVPM